MIKNTFVTLKNFIEESLSTNAFFFKSKELLENVIQTFFLMFTSLDSTLRRQVIEIEDGLISTVFFFFYVFGDELISIL